MQYRYAIKTCNTDLQYRYAIKIRNGYATYMQHIRNEDMQRVCNTYATYMQQICNIYAMKICNIYATDMQQICNRYATETQKLLLGLYAGIICVESDFEIKMFGILQPEAKKLNSGN